MRQTVHIVWFKRDLRIEDHAPLAEAARLGSVLPLYVVEPDYWSQPDASARQYAVVRESLRELRAALATIGQPLIVRVGAAVAVLEALAREFDVVGLWSHQESGNAWTYARDRAVAAWARDRGIAWHERRQFGVVRGLRLRKQWVGQWEALMAHPCAPPPRVLPALLGIEPGAIPALSTIAAEDGCSDRQIGGRRAALALLDSFLHVRGARYHREMSSPISAQVSCSRLSVALATGAVSLREIVQAARARHAQLEAGDPQRRALLAYGSRLHWHCHFIQKLESEPAIEFENFHRGYDGLRDTTPDRARLDAWSRGATGWPLVDASMAMLRASGWINFRMRAMLMAVASYHLWLHWRHSGLVLARLFTDYEPGIHWSQCQMQSGVTGINVPRIYNPIKQSHDQDPQGDFIRRWLPALARVPAPWVHEPSKMPRRMQQQLGCVIDSDYPAPCVDHMQAARDAKTRLGQWRRQPGMREGDQAVLARHGSRRRRIAERKAVEPVQASLFGIDANEVARTQRNKRGRK